MNGNYIFSKHNIEQLERCLKYKDSRQYKIMKILIKKIKVNRKTIKAQQKKILGLRRVIELKNNEITRLMNVIEIKDQEIRKLNNLLDQNHITSTQPNMDSEDYHEVERDHYNRVRNSNNEPPTKKPEVKAMDKYGYYL
ncbi:16624_t:CDS:2, partial [Cetraspora pellucida]